MRDIVDIRRGRVLMDSEFPEALQNAYRGMERMANPWGMLPIRDQTSIQDRIASGAIKTDKTAKEMVRLYYRKIK